MAYSVLVVDDEPMARTMLRLMLVRAGFDVREAEDGKTALAEVAQLIPDLMILDIMMPGIDGFEVCTRLRSESATATLPIIMLSARTDAQSVKKGLELGADRYLTKPVGADELTRHVREVLSIEDEVPS